MVWVLCLAMLGMAQWSSAQLPALSGVQRLAAGEFHTCALGNNGRVSCWGSNRFGQLGALDASEAQRETPVDVSVLGADVAAISAGRTHTCALRSNGGVLCWGQNNFGQLGDGSVLDRSEPVFVSGLGANVMALAAGEEHTCAITTLGQVKCWGRNDFGQLGNGTRMASSVPVDTATITSGASAISTGRYHSCAVRGNAALCWGRNDTGQLGDGSTAQRDAPVSVSGQQAGVRSLAAGRAHSCSLSLAGAVSCWGSNTAGQLGDGSNDSRTTAIGVSGLADGVIAISANLQHSCAVTSSGAVRCWGDNFFGQLGDGTAINRNAPTAVSTLESGASVVASGYRHNCAVIGTQGEVRCWGNNFDGQLGDDTFSNRLTSRDVVGLSTGVSLVGTGFQHSCGYGASRGLLCWGDNAQGQLGNGTSASAEVPVPVAISEAVRAMDGGIFHSCALTVGGAVRCWGSNSFGQLGDRSNTSSLSPVDVAGLGSGVNAIATGGSHSCALTGAGAVSCWGSNNAGQLGTGSTQSVNEPAATLGLGSGVIAIASGQSHSCALTSARTVKCWGANFAGQLGTGNTTRRVEPVDVVGLGADVQAIAAGGDFSCALTANASVLCWGSNFYGQIGDGSFEDRVLPTPVQGLGAGTRSLETSYYHACAIDAGSALRCWGRNTEGQLGINGTTSRPVAVPVSGLTSGVAAFSGGGGQSCVRMSSGAAKCWGANNFGQVGDGTTWARRIAVKVVVNEATRQVAAVTPAANAESLASVTDASGRYIVFQSLASNLASNDSNSTWDVFRVDTVSGSTVRVSVSNSGQQISGESIEPDVSADGNLVVFVAPDAAVSDLEHESRKAAAARIKGGGSAVFLRNLLAGTTQRIGSARTGRTGTTPTIAAGATAIAWTQPNSGGNGIPGQDNVYVAPLTRQGNAVVVGPAICATCKALGANGQPGTIDSNGASRNPSISADGNWLAWETEANNLLATDEKASACPGASSSIVLRNLVGQQAAQVSTPAAGASCGTPAQGSSRPQVDDSGQRVVFESSQPLMSGDDNASADVYVWDNANASLTRVSTGPAGESGTGASVDASISADGSMVAFVSSAPNLDVSFADNNGAADIHLRDALAASPALRLSRSTSGGEATSDSGAPALNADGSLISFETLAANLVLGANGGFTNVAQRVSPAAATSLKSATWWNPAESGWGVFTLDQGNVMAVGWFTYDNDGEPTWFLVPGASPQADGSYLGDVIRVGGVAFDLIDGPAVTSVTSLGSATLRFPTPDSLEFDYTVAGTRQVRSLSKFPFGSQTLTCRPSITASRSTANNFSDLWWSGPASPGWGVHISHLGNDLFATWYTYDPDGEAVFLVGATSRQPDGSFRGPLFRQVNGTPFLQIQGQPPSSGATVAGEVTLRFDDGERGEFTYTVGNTTQSKPLSRFVFGNAPGVCSVTSIARQAGDPIKRPAGVDPAIAAVAPPVSSPARDQAAFR